jgi:hypothetical protein
MTKAQGLAKSKLAFSKVHLSPTLGTWGQDGERGTGHRSAHWPEQFDESSILRVSDAFETACD